MYCPHYHYNDGDYYCDLLQNNVSEAKIIENQHSCDFAQPC